MNLHYNDSMITQSRLMELVTYDAAAGVLRWRTRRGNTRPGARIGGPDKEGYWRVRLDDRQYLEHRLVWLWHHGSFPRILDHIDRDRSNNRIENLRLCTESQNAANAKISTHNTSGYRGVYYEAERDKWVARIRLVIEGERVRYRIGRFDTAEEAAIAYNLHLRQHFSEYALLNRVDTPLGRILGMS